MVIALTMMARDEADIIGRMVQHHLDHGVDFMIVTDNGSVDGTTDILAEFERQGVLELRHDPVHRKQQGEVVTCMARDAAIRGADWVINADADEFWVPVDRSRTLAAVLAELDPAIGSAEIPVVDLIGAPAKQGTGFGRLVYRDLRPDERMREIGLHGHSTSDALHVADPEIVVAQGNHAVSILSNGSIPDELRLEVLHLQWRSWAQFVGKVENAGRAYEASPDLRPSPNHHGMRDYRRLKDGTLEAAYVVRHPDDAELATGLSHGWFVRDDTLAGYRAAVEDALYEEPELAQARALFTTTYPLEQRLMALERTSAQAVRELDHERTHVAELDAQNAELQARISALTTDLDRLRGRKVVRLVDRSAEILRRRS